ncbi:MAG: FG-GAP-like repeat-containing protein, partial [Marinoscillum sp.]
SFLTFSLPNAISTTFIENDKSDQDTIKIVMPAGTTVNGAAPTFTIPPGAEAKVVGAVQESEVTTQNFLENVTYTVGVPGGAVSQDWIVIVDTPPSITAISPNTSIVGTSLFINGSNFSSDSEVYFGGVQANVTEASATSISVDVPLGVSLAPISVLSNGLYGEYSTDFNLTFDSPDLDSLLFDKEQLIDRPASSMAVRLADFDADGINDILIASADKISVHKFIFVQDVNDQLNIQLSPTLSFEYPVITTKESVEIADFNGDGFTDFAVIDQGKNVMIFLNQSSGQPFTFSDPINLGINENGGSTILKVADLNTDGRYDILVNDDGNVMVFQNTGEVSGTLDFDSLTVAVPNLYFKEIEIVDLDLDGKKDLLILDNYFQVYTLRNISDPSGNSTFAAMQTISLPEEFIAVSIANTDLDGDSKADVAVMGMESVLVLPNASTGEENISFGSPIDLSKILEDGNISLGDLDGDGKVDLVASTSLDPNVTNYEGALSLYKNTSVSGAISFEPEVLLPRTDFHVKDIAIVDLDNDTRSEIIGVGADKLLILMNTKTDKELFSLDIAGQVSSTFKDAVDTDIDSVVVVMPYGTSVLALKPDFLVSPGATVSPDTTVARGFAEPVTFTITAEDNTTKEWLVIVEAESNTWTGTSWSEGSPPTNIHNAIIAAAYNFSENGSFAANNLTVNNETALVVNGEGTLDVKGDLSNMGSLIVESGASLMTYAGKNVSDNIIIKRDTRYAGGKYSFVGSPVKENENVRTSGLGPIVYAYDEAQPYGDDDGLDRWIRQNNEILIPSKGYAQARQKEIAFTGVPNDGTVTIEGTYSGTANDVINDASEGWTLVANPYPAAIGVNAFLTENDNIAGAVYIWDDNGSNTGRGSNSDYIIANAVEAINTEPTPAGGASRYNLHLGSAQGFFVKLLGTGDNEIVFTEDMRVSGSNSDGNFFRKTTIPKIRLNLTDEQGLFKQTLVGWVDGIDDNQMNRLYDA